MPADDDDFLGGCDATDFTVDPDDPETTELRALFPDGVADEGRAQQWRDLGLAVARGEIEPV